MKKLAMVIPYYDNPIMLGLQYATWASYPKEAKDAMQIILVDDGSPNSPAANVLRPAGLPELVILRHVVDRPWHQHAARNTGANYASAEWLLLTDMDHMLRPVDLLTLLNIIGGQPGRRVHTLNRREPDGTLTRNERGELKPHPNSFAMGREMYWQIGGYDEALCGIYGTDSDFRARAFAKGIHVHLAGVYLTRYSRLIVDDASTRTLQRKEGRISGAREAAIAARIARGIHGPETLTMGWERVA